MNDEKPSEIADVRENTKFDTQSPSKLTTVFKLTAKGNELKNQYGFLIPKLASSMMKRGFSVNPFHLISFLPYLMLAMQKANAPLANEQQSVVQSSGLGNVNLANALRDPENLKKLFSQQARGELAIDSLKLLAGPRVSTIVDQLMEEIKNSATDKRDGVAGIDGKHLIAVLQRSDALKNLFLTDELTNEGLSFLNTYVDSYLSPELKNVKSEVLAEINEKRNNRQNNDSVVQHTLSDSVAALFKVGYKKFNENLARLSSDAEKNLMEWKRIADDGNEGSSMSTAGQFKKAVIKKTPTFVLKKLATGHALVKNQYQLLSSFATFFLPTGLPMDILKFLCLMTYITIMVREENLIPETVKDRVKIPKLNTENIIDTLNDKDLMSKIFPSNDRSNVRINMLKFLAGPEANVMDSLVDELRKMKKEKGVDQLSVYDLLGNVEFFKKLYAMKEKADAGLKNYLGVDVGQLKKEVADEYAKNPDANANVSTKVTNALSATYQVGLRKANERMKNVNEEIAREADQMTRAPPNTLDESTAAGLFRKAASAAPTSVLYGLAGAKVAANRLSGWFRRTDGDRPQSVDRARPTAVGGETS